MTTRLHGAEAIEYCEKTGTKPNHYTTPIDDAREKITLEEANDIAREDAGLIYVEVEEGVPYMARVVEHEDILINCPKCGSDTVEDQTDDYDAKSGRSSDESDPIYFDMCPKCGWNNGPKN